MKIIIIIITFWFNVYSSFAQNSKDSLLYTLPINISYFGEKYTHYGFKVGLEYPIISKVKVSENWRGKSKFRETQFFTTGNIGLYRHPKNLYGSFINSELGLRRCTRRFHIETFAGVGYLRTFRDGPTYEITADGKVQQIYLAGDNRFSPTFAIGVGKGFLKKQDKAMAFHIRYIRYFEIPYYSKYLKRTAIELGITYRLRKKTVTNENK